MKVKIVVLCVFLISYSFVFAQTETEKATLIKAGAAMPVFTVKTLAGKIVDSREFKGKVVLLNFWATWCPPCKKEMPFLQKDVFDQFKDKDFIMLAVSRGEKETVVKDFVHTYKYTFDIGLDPDSKVYKLFASMFIPRNFVIDKNGIVKLASVGYEEKEFAAMIDLIKAELAR
jgi:peroxiredoxin